MKRPIVIAAAVVAALLSATTLAASKTESRVDDAIEVFQTFTQIPEQGIPPSILKDAYGVAILPGVIKVGFTIAGRYGKGVLLVRQDDGNWSNPAFISLGGGSLGLQVGAQSTDIVLVFRDRRSIDNIFKGKLTLGGDASVAAGPVGRQSSAATDQRLAAEIFSYSRNRGLFAGVALDGAWLGMDKKSNEAYYGNGMSPEELLEAYSIPTPLAAAQLTDLVAATAPRIDGAPVSRSAQAEIEETVEVKTYAIEPIEADDGDMFTGGGDETTF
jgi:lipid-binding SYLF domain-containing protein